MSDNDRCPRCGDGQCWGECEQIGDTGRRDRWQAWIDLGEQIWAEAHQDQSGHASPMTPRRLMDRMFEQWSPEAWDALAEAMGDDDGDQG